MNDKINYWRIFYEMLDSLFHEIPSPKNVTLNKELRLAQIEIIFSQKCHSLVPATEPILLIFRLLILIGIHVINTCTFDFPYKDSSINSFDGMVQPTPLTHSGWFAVPLSLDFFYYNKWSIDRVKRIVVISDRHWRIQNLIHKFDLHHGRCPTERP